MALELRRSLGRLTGKYHHNSTGPHCTQPRSGQVTKSHLQHWGSICDLGVMTATEYSTHRQAS
jgi:hypothetical protein